MEEILASIRRIISEDEEDPAPAMAQTPAAAPAAERAPDTAKPELTLTPQAARPAAPEPADREPVETEPAPFGRDSAADLQAKTEDLEMISKNVTAAMQDESQDEILDHTAAAAASQAFQNLSQSVRISEGPGRTLEDLVTEMLRPMVKDWLNANLPAIVEEKVEEEVQRVARRRRG